MKWNFQNHKKSYSAIILTAVCGNFTLVNFQIWHDFCI